MYTCASTPSGRKIYMIWCVYVIYSCTLDQVLPLEERYTWFDVYTSYTCIDFMKYSLWKQDIYVVDLYEFDVQPIAFGLQFNLNLQSQYPWSLFNRTWQKRPRELECRMGFENEEMTLKIITIGCMYDSCMLMFTWSNTLSEKKV